MNYFRTPFKRHRDILDGMSADAMIERTSAIIVLIGAGGLGCAVLPRIVRLRPARFIIIDGDRVEQRNLDRQPLYADVDIGFPKASTAALWARQVMPAGSVAAVDVFLDANNAYELIAQADVVVEGVDDPHAKRLVDRVCAASGVPLVSGGVHQRQGQVLVLHAPGDRQGLGRDDVFRGVVGAEQDACDMRDVPLGLLEEIGARMAQRCADLLFARPVTNGRIELFDGSHWINFAPPA